MKVPYGEADFYAVRTQGYLYIDKTKYIENLEQNKKVIFTRPRRFGKSMLTSMLSYYYDINQKDNFEKLFKGLSVYDNPTQYKNNYYVMNFNFSGMNVSENEKLEDIETMFDNKVYDAIDLFINKYGLNIKIDKTRKAAGMLSEVLKEFMNLKKQNKIYIIIDEYDHFTNGILKGNAERFLEILGNTGFVRAFYEVIKEYLEIPNPPLERFFATGVTPITLDSMTSGFNIATKITNSPLFTAMCGLTDEEVLQAIEMAGITGEEKQNAFNKMKENYDGYICNEEDATHLFNTTLVMYYLRELTQVGRPPRNLVDGNLAATGTKIENMAGLVNREDNYKALDELLLTGEISGNLTDSFEIDKRFNKNDFISMLYYNGYLTIKEADGMETIFTQPNYVTKVLYSSYFTQISETAKKYQIKTDKIENAIIELGKNGNLEPLVEQVKYYIQHFSVRDKENFNEMNLKHIFEMLSMLTEQFAVYGEYPAGQGFADILIKKATNSHAKYEAIMELKYIKEKDKKKANIKKLKQEAVKQLEEYMKDDRLGHIEHLKKYVVIFKGFEDYYVEEL